jgi:hypothetical protein
MIINVDGMPVSNYEYNLTNDETKVRTVFVLARYYREYEGKEYLTKPEYLDALHANRINPGKTEALILHIKVINLSRVPYTFYWECKRDGDPLITSTAYHGQLSRKDFALRLPKNVPGNYIFSFRLEDRNGDDLFALPPMRYKIKEVMPAVSPRP